MKEHHTKTKGDLGVLKAQLDLYEKCYYINPNEYTTTFTLRISPTKNNQKIGINLAEDYINIPKDLSENRLDI